MGDPTAVRQHATQALLALLVLLLAVAVPARADAAAEPAGPAAPASLDGPIYRHVGGDHLANGLGALGIGFGDVVDPGDVVAVAHGFGMKVGHTLDPHDIDAVAARVWGRVGRWMAVSGLGFAAPADGGDLLRHAGPLGVEFGDRLEPDEARAVLQAGNGRVRDQLRELGFPGIGDEIRTRDIIAAAQMYGRALPSRLLRPEDTLQTLAHVGRGLEPGRTPRYARIGNVDLHLPAARVEYAGLHQAASWRALAQPRFGPALVDILPSRGRGTHRTGAVDVQMWRSQEVLAPVTGTVVEASGYRLYGRYTDQRVRIVPDADTSLLTTVLHVSGLRVRPGDRVEAGVTPIAWHARQFPFVSQIDRVSSYRLGHVHIETRRR